MNQQEKEVYIKNNIDFSSVKNFELSVAYVGVIHKFKSMEKFVDWIEENCEGKKYDKFIAYMAELAEWKFNFDKKKGSVN